MDPVRHSCVVSMFSEGRSSYLTVRRIINIAVVNLQQPVSISKAATLCNPP